MTEELYDSMGHSEEAILAHVEHIDKKIDRQATQEEQRLSQVYIHSAKQSQKTDNAIADVTNRLNESMQKQADLSDSRFHKTVTDIAAVKAADVHSAKQRAEMDKDIADTTSSLRDSMHKQAALSDARFSKIATDIAAVKADAAAQTRRRRRSTR